MKITKLKIKNQWVQVRPLTKKDKKTRRGDIFGDGSRISNVGYPIYNYNCDGGDSQIYRPIPKPLKSEAVKRKPKIKDAIGWATADYSGQILAHTVRATKMRANSDRPMFEGERIVHVTISPTGRRGNNNLWKIPQPIGQ